jgi:hypothetical protein
MREPTQRDVDILLRLWEMQNAPEMHAARMWVHSEFRAADFEEFKRKYPSGSVEWRRFTSVYGMYEMYGLLICRGLLNEDLFFDLFGGIGLLWDRLEPVIGGMRHEIDPYLYENFELLSRRADTWKAAHPPKVAR